MLWNIRGTAPMNRDLQAFGSMVPAAVYQWSSMGAITIPGSISAKHYRTHGAGADSHGRHGGDGWMQPSDRDHGCWPQMVCFSVVVWDKVGQDTSPARLVWMGGTTIINDIPSLHSTKFDSIKSSTTNSNDSSMAFPFSRCSRPAGCTLSKSPSISFDLILLCRPGSFPGRCLTFVTLPCPDGRYLAPLYGTQIKSRTTLLLHLRFVYRPSFPAYTLAHLNTNMAMARGCASPGIWASRELNATNQARSTGSFNSHHPLTGFHSSFSTFELDLQEDQAKDL